MKLFEHNISEWSYPVQNGNTIEYCKQEDDMLKCVS